MTFTRDDIPRLIGATVLDPDGVKVGRLGSVYLGPDDEPSWATVRTGFFGSSESFFPLQSAALADRDLRVPFTKDVVTGAPALESDEELSLDQSNELTDYYRSHDGAAERADSDHADAESGREPSAAGAMTRSEERLDVGMRSTERGRVRLRKHIVTEEQTVSVPVSREEARLVREPVTAAEIDGIVARELSEEEHEIVLHAEVAVVDKRIVPVERVRLDKVLVTEQQDLSAEVRKERVDLVHTDGTVR